MLYIRFVVLEMDSRRLCKEYVTQCLCLRSKDISHCIDIDIVNNITDLSSWTNG